MHTCIRTYLHVDSLVEYMDNHDKKKHRWNFPVKISIKCTHSISDIMISDTDEKPRTAVEINRELKFIEKDNAYEYRIEICKYSMSITSSGHYLIIGALE